MMEGLWIGPSNNSRSSELMIWLENYPGISGCPDFVSLMSCSWEALSRTCSLFMKQHCDALVMPQPVLLKKKKKDIISKKKIKK